MGKLTQEENFQLSKLFSKMDSDDISSVYTLAKSARGRLDMMKSVSLYVGQPVSFVGKRKVIVKGKITKVNTKTVKVQAESGVLWTVSTSLIKTED
jgi:hypothetical protein